MHSTSLHAFTVNIFRKSLLSGWKETLMRNCNTYLIISKLLSFESIAINAICDWSFFFNVMTDLDFNPSLDEVFDLDPFSLFTIEIESKVVITMGKLLILLSDSIQSAYSLTAGVSYLLITYEIAPVSEYFSFTGNFTRWGTVWKNHFLIRFNKTLLSRWKSIIPGEVSVTVSDSINQFRFIMTNINKVSLNQFLYTFCWVKIFYKIICSSGLASYLFVSVSNFGNLVVILVILRVSNLVLTDQEIFVVVLTVGTIEEFMVLSYLKLSFARVVASLVCLVNRSIVYFRIFTSDTDF